MVVRSLSGLSVCAVAIVAAGSAVAQPAKVAKAPPKPAPAAVEPLGVDHYWLYATIVDPIPTAVRDALDSAGRSGAFLDKRDAAGVAAFYAERRYAPVWTENGTLTGARAEAVIARLARPMPTASTRAPIATPPLDFGKAGEAAPPIRPPLRSSSPRRSSPTPAKPMPAGWCPSQVSDNIGYEQHLPDPVAVLDTVSSAPRTRPPPLPRTTRRSPSLPPSAPSSPSCEESRGSSRGSGRSRFRPARR